MEKNIEAFLKLELPGTKVIIGDGPALQDLQSKYTDVIFTGCKRGDELAGLLASSDCFVFPSLTDTFGLVMIEAMACGLPVAAFPVRGPLDVVENGINGMLDTDLRRAALEAIKLNPAQCRIHAQSYSWKHCTDQFYNNLWLDEDIQADAC